MKRSYLAIAPLLLCAAAHAQEWQIDSAHSAAQFSVRHLMVSTVRGHFGKISGTVRYDPANPSAASIQSEVDVSTIDTRVAKRDAHLKSPDFFDVEKYPTMSFKSTKVEPAGSGALKVTGDMTMRGVTKPVVFNVEGLDGSDQGSEWSAYGRGCYNQDQPSGFWHDLESSHRGGWRHCRG